MNGMPQRPDQYYGAPDAGQAPGPRSVLRANKVIIIGAAGGEFVYDAAGELRSANVGQTTTDPIHHITCFEGFSTFNGLGAVVSLLSTNPSGFFQYQDLGTSTQGTMILSVASGSGTDPVTGATFGPGLFGVDPVFGDFISVVGARILFGIGTLITLDGQVHIQAAPANNQNPYIAVDAPEETTAKHVQMLLQGASPDGTRPGQALIGQVSGSAVLTPVTTAMLEVQAISTAPAIECITPAGLQDVYDLAQVGDTNARWKVRSGGETLWGPGNAAQDVTLRRSAANILQLQTADFDVSTAGRGLRVAEGANAKQGTATLAGGTVLVANTSVTANSRIFPAAQDNNSTGALRISARVAGASFTITSSNAADSGVVAYQIFEPG